MQSAEKQYFLFNKGINTEAPLIQWPEGFSIDEQNFDLLVDGSRRRRPGLVSEQYLVGDQLDTIGTISNDVNFTAGQVIENDTAYTGAHSVDYIITAPPIGSFTGADIGDGLTVVVLSANSDPDTSYPNQQTVDLVIDNGVGDVPYNVFDSISFTDESAVTRTLLRSEAINATTLVPTPEGLVIGTGRLWSWRINPASTVFLNGQSYTVTINRTGIIPGIPYPEDVFEGSSTDTAGAMRTFRWTDAGHIAGFNLIVAQIGYFLYFWNEPTSGQLGSPDFSIDLSPYIAKYTDDFTGDTFTNTLTDLRNAICDFAQINGKLIVVNEYLEPLMVKYDTSSGTPELDITQLAIKERDLFGIEDGIPVNTKPSVLSNAHEYNLWNRGWTAQQIVDFQASQVLYPAKNMIAYMGMRRQVATGYNDNDGIKVFSPDKLVEELFQNMSAPQGHMMREVFNRRNNFTTTLGESANTHTITGISVTSIGGGQWSCTITSADAHGVIAGDHINLDGLTIKWKKEGGDKIKRTYSGDYVVQSTVSATQFKINIAGNDPWTYVFTVTYGTYVETDSVVGSVFNEDDSAIPCETRFATTASFASRIFYAGCRDERISNRVYFSKVVEQDTDVQICYQEADPTSEFISDLVATDGGYITLAEAGAIVGLRPFGRSMIVFATNGIWEIGPGREGFFSAVGYSERKISSMGCVSPRSIIDAGDIPMYWGEDGIYAIQQDPNSGYTLATNVTRDVINGLYNSIRYQQKSRASGAYDPTRRRAIWLYNSRLVNPISAEPPETGESMVQTTPVTPVGTIDDSDTTEDWFDSALVFDLRLKAWTRWVFGDSTTHAVRGIISMPSSYLTDNENRFKFFSQRLTGDTTKWQVGELLNRETYADNGAEAEAFVYSGPDSVSDPNKLKSAPYVHVFMRRTDDNSIFMQPRWDWSRGSVSGKMGEYRQVYRETRQRPEAYGLIVTKNKVPGRGRNLFLAFKSESGHEAWLDGWTVKYDASMRV